MMHPRGETGAMEAPPQHQVWVNPANPLYYQVHLGQDLLGDWALIKVWGRLGSRLGRMHNTGVASYDDGLEQVREIAQRRTQHGYRVVPPR
jgi:hypothetical protein